MDYSTGTGIKMTLGKGIGCHVVIVVLLFLSETMVKMVTAEEIGCIRQPFLAKMRFLTNGYTQSVRYDVKVPQMQGFTTQFWINLQDATSRNATVLSYAVNIHNLDSLVLKYIGGDQPKWELIITGLTIFSENSPVLTEGQWHHIVVSWNSRNAGWALFVNGHMVNAGFNNQRLYLYVPGGGQVAVGGLQQTFRDGMDIGEGVDGWITHFNLDSEPISDPFSTQDQEQVMSWKTWCPIVDLGNVIGWISSPRKLYGGVIEAPANIACAQF